MKRSQLKRSRPKHVDRLDPARQAWKSSPAGFCQNCSGFSMHLHRHHVVTEAHVRREGGDPWAGANAMLLCERCHMNHHSAFRRIPLEAVPAAAIDFARRLLGDDRAALYFARFYDPAEDRRAA